MLSLAATLPKDALVQQIYDGLILLVLGMGTVFIFLVLLICISKLMSRICMRLSPAEAEVKKPANRQNTAALGANAKNDAAVAAAIAAAYDKEK